MSEIKLAIVMTIVMSVGLLGLGASPAAAHGNCGAESSAPSFNGNVAGPGGGEWTWIATGVCDEAHYDTYMRTCLEKSTGTQVTGPTSWESAGSCVEREWSQARREWTIPVTTYYPCEPLHWYRTYTVFSPGNGGSHWGTVAKSPAVRPCDYLLLLQ